MGKRRRENRFWETAEAICEKENETAGEAIEEKGIYKGKETGYVPALGEIVEGQQDAERYGD